jgi:hypothetical protein
MKKVSLYWSAAVGLISTLLQVLGYYIRFGELNEFATVPEYLAFFAAGLLGGLILIFFLNRQESSKGWWAVMIAFVLATPVAMIFMLGGGMLGYIGILIFPLIPWAIVTWLGSIIGKFISKR